MKMIIENITKHFGKKGRNQEILSEYEIKCCNCVYLWSGRCHKRSPIDDYRWPKVNEDHRCRDFELDINGL